MKKIIIKKLRLLNFCGIRDAEYEFSEKLTIVSGGNGKGKSTIANSIMYVLFGTDMAGNSLDIKTFDKNHEIIKEIPHEAELTMLVDGAKGKRPRGDGLPDEKIVVVIVGSVRGAVHNLTAIGQKHADAVKIVLVGDVRQQLLHVFALVLQGKLVAVGPGTGGT